MTPNLVTLEEIQATYGAGNYAETERLCHIFCKDNPGNAEGWLYKGASERQLKKYNEAIESFTQSLSLDESNWLTWNFRGETYYDSGDYDRAFNDFWYCLQLNPREGAVMDRCARSLYRGGRYDYALELIQKTIELQEDVTAYIIKAHMLKMLGRIDEAETTLIEGIRVFPEEVEMIRKYRNGESLDY